MKGLSQELPLFWLNVSFKTCFSLLSEPFRKWLYFMLGQLYPTWATSVPVLASGVDPARDLAAGVGQEMPPCVLGH